MAARLTGARLTGARRPLPAVVVEEATVAALADGPLPYTLRRSWRARHLRVVVDPARGVVVTIPAGSRVGAVAGRRIAASFLAEREAWVRRHLARQAEQRAAVARRGPLEHDSTILFRGIEHRLVFAPAPPTARWSAVLHDGGAAELIVRLASRDARPTGAVLETWLRDDARVEIDAAIRRHAASLGVTPRAVSIRDTRSRWGSASRAGRLSFSWRLTLAPPEALDTVVIHELAHLRVFGHGPSFWALVATQRPDHRHWRRWLRDHATELYSAFDGP